MARVVWFEFFTEEAAKDRAFYKEAFGWESEQWGDRPYWLWLPHEKTQPGIPGGIGLSLKQGMTQSVVCTISTENSDAATAKAVAAGATVVVPKQAVRGTGWLTYLADPAGIVLGLMQYDESAK